MNTELGQKCVAQFCFRRATTQKEISDWSTRQPVEMCPKHTAEFHGSVGVVGTKRRCAACGDFMKAKEFGAACEACRSNGIQPLSLL